MADNMPDFDSMSQEEIMAWMETLAKRQGANEGFTTEADMDIAEIDPSTVIIDEPGYIPYGQERPPQPISPSEPALKSPLSAPSAARSAHEEENIPVRPVVEEGSLAWLESLAAGQSDDIFNLDLSTLSEDVPMPAPSKPELAIDPVSWLEDLARGQDEFDLPSQERPAQRPAEPARMTGDSTMWLESLARRQGARPEELTTPADLEVDMPENAEPAAYIPFTFDTPPSLRRSAPTEPEPLELEDPAAWLNSLAAEQGYSEAGVRQTQPSSSSVEDDLSLEAIEEAIARGTVTPEQMQVFLDHQTELAAEALSQADDEPFELDADAPAVPAELPDWLLEQVGPPPKPKADSPNLPPLEEVLAQAPTSGDIPDWLLADVDEADELDLSSIFEQMGEDEDVTAIFGEDEFGDEAAVGRVQLAVDPNDPWVEAFDLEYEQGQINLDELPDWYQRNLHDPARIAAVESLASAEDRDADEIAPVEPLTSALIDQPLPVETELEPGEAQALPTWMQDLLPTEPEPAATQGAPPAAEALLVDDVPDWLREVEGEVTPDEIPAWLVEVEAAETQPTAFEFETPEPAPLSAFVEPFSSAQTIPAVQTPPPTLAGSASLERARSKQQSGALEESLREYEKLVRQSEALEEVVNDLSTLVRIYKDNPVVYRILGDGLMRQGKLQAALDTYRAALNQL
ncbi:MAG: hypothetical protein SNJ59_02975 [Aggregatilineales bacterium]